MAHLGLWHLGFASLLALAALPGCGSEGVSEGGVGGNGSPDGGTGGSAVATGGSSAGGQGSVGGSGFSGSGAGGLPGSGGMTQGGGSGGTASGAGGTHLGGSSSGGSPGTGGAPVTSGGAGAGGTASGGSATGGAASGGSTTGGAASGGTASGGAASAGAGNGGTGGSDATPVFHVFLLLGQSNMAGYSKAEPADKVEDERIQVLGFDDCAATGRQTNEWDVAVPPLHECWNGALGPGDYFAKTLVDALPEGDTIGLVPCAISGERIETFMKVGGTKYEWILERARMAQQAGGVIEGMLFHQGESNCGDPAWPGKVGTLVEDLRADLGASSAPFLAGELPYDGNCSNHNPLVNDIPNVITNAHVVSARDLVVDPADTEWNLHFDHDSQVTLGARFADTMTRALGW